METGTDKTYHDQWMSKEYEPGLVSVIVPTYNRARFLVEAMDSVFAQTYRPIELLVIDDASTDNSGDRIEAWCAEKSADVAFRGVYIRQPENKGAPAARNLGVINSKGQFVVFHDSDDLMDEDRIQLQAQRLVTEDSDLCEGSWKSLPPETRSYICQNQSSDLLLDFLEDRVAGATICWMIRRNLMFRVGPWNESLACYQDIDLTFRLSALRPRTSFEPESVVFVRQQHDGRITMLRKTEEGFRSVLKSHQTRCSILQSLSPNQAYLLPESRKLTHFAVLAYARGYHALAAEFEALSRSAEPRPQWGSTALQRFLFAAGGVPLCGRLMSLKRRLFGKIATQFHGF